MVKKDKDGVVLTTELVGIKNLKTTGNYRLEFDVYEIDTTKVKELIDKLNKAYVEIINDSFSLPGWSLDLSGLSLDAPGGPGDHF